MHDEWSCHIRELFYQIKEASHRAYKNADEAADAMESLKRTPGLEVEFEAASVAVTQAIETARKADKIRKSAARHIDCHYFYNTDDPDDPTHNTAKSIAPLTKLLNRHLANVQCEASLTYEKYTFVLELVNKNAHLLRIPICDCGQPVAPDCSMCTICEEAFYDS